MIKISKFIISFIFGGIVFGAITTALLLNYFSQGAKYIEISEGTQFIYTNVSVLKLGDSELRCRLASLTLYEVERLKGKIPDKPNYLISEAEHQIFKDLLGINVRYVEENGVSEMSSACE